MPLATSGYCTINRGGVLLIRDSMMRRGSGWYFPHDIERRVVKHIAIRLIFDDSVKRSVASHNNSDRTLDDGGAVPISQVVSVTKRLQLSVSKRPYLFAVVLEVDKEDKGLARVRIEDAIPGNFEAGMEVRYWVCLVKDFEKGIDVETL